MSVKSIELILKNHQIWIMKFNDLFENTNDCFIYNFNIIPKKNLIQIHE